MKYYLIMPSMFEDESMAVTEFVDMDDLNEWAELNEFKKSDYVVVHGNLIHYGDNNETNS